MTQAIESIGRPNALFVYNTRARGQVNSHAMARLVKGCIVDVWFTPRLQGDFWLAAWCRRTLT